MKIHTCEQGTLEWLKLRAGKVTASELDGLLTPEMAIRTKETPHTYLCLKLAEKVTGMPEMNGGAWVMDQGHMKESDALAWYEMERDCEITQIGFCESDDGRAGCSPDGLVGEDGGLEIKSPLAKTHVKYLLGETLPKEYVAQVHGSLYFTGRKWWDFMSYCPGFPPFSIRIERDEAIMAKIAACLAEFYTRFDAALEKLK